MQLLPANLLASMTIPIEPIGSIPRRAELFTAVQARASGQISREQLLSAEQVAVRDTIRRFAETGFPIVTVGEHTKSSLATYPLIGLTIWLLTASYFPPRMDIRANSQD